MRDGQNNENAFRNQNYSGPRLRGINQLLMIAPDMSEDSSVNSLQEDSTQRSFSGCAPTNSPQE